MAMRRRAAAWDLEILVGLWRWAVRVESLRAIMDVVEGRVAWCW
jgi:hypothetical protein